MKHLSPSFLSFFLTVGLLSLRPHQGLAQLSNPESRVEQGGTGNINIVSGGNVLNPNDVTHNFLVRRNSPGTYAAVLRIVNNGRVGIGRNLSLYEQVSMLNVGQGANRMTVDEAGSVRNGVRGDNYIPGAGACIGFNASRKSDASYECEPGLLDEGNLTSTEKRNGGALIWSTLKGELNFTCLPSAHGEGVDASSQNYYYADDIKSYRVMRIRPSMQVQIGRLAPQTGNAHDDYRLAVDGKLVARSIFVTSAT